MGSVASHLAPRFPVVTNDLLSFTGAFARARFLDTPRRPGRELMTELWPVYHSHAAALRDRYGRRLAAERRALSGSVDDLGTWMASAPHAGASSRYKRLAKKAAHSESEEHYSHLTLYFASAYFSTAQAIELDSLRRAIDERPVQDERDRLLAAWIAAAAVAINAPGHTAQYLKPRHEGIYLRIRRQWARSIWSLFVDALEALKPQGDHEWRRRNRVYVADALELLRSGVLGEAVGAVYADPPYTRDQYSRFYHVYETMYRYDFPESTGEGRIRPDRTPSPFCLVTQVAQAFEALFSMTAALGVPLVLSYPSDGLLTKRGIDVESLASDYFQSRVVTEIHYHHSTMGGSSGKKSKDAMERIYVYVP
jgi:adenine-specific DNA-methyltransferase